MQIIATFEDINVINIQNNYFVVRIFGDIVNSVIPSDSPFGRGAWQAKYSMKGIKSVAQPRSLASARRWFEFFKQKKDIPQIGEFFCDFKSLNSTVI